MTIGNAILVLGLVALTVYEPALCILWVMVAFAWWMVGR